MFPFAAFSLLDSFFLFFSSSSSSLLPIIVGSCYYPVPIGPHHLLLLVCVADALSYSA